MNHFINQKPVPCGAILSAVVIVACLAFVVPHARAGDWSNPYRLDIMSGSANGDGWADIAFDPRCAYSPEGVVHVVYNGGYWSDDKPNTWEIWYTSLHGSDWSTPIKLSNNNTTTRGASIAVGGDGVVHVAWEESEDRVIKYRYSSNLGDTWSSGQQLTSGLGPRLAAGPAGNVVMLYMDTIGGDWQVRGKTKLAGSSWGSSTTIDSSKGDYQRPLNMNAYGTAESPVFYAVFEGDAGYNMETYTAQWTPTDGWIRVTNLSQMAESGFTGDVADLGGDVVLGCWFQGPLYFRKSTDRGQSWGSRFDLGNFTGGGFGQRFPKLVADGFGGAHLVYDEESSSSPTNSVFYQHYDGSSFSSREKVSTKRSAGAFMIMGNDELHCVFGSGGIYYSSKYVGAGTPPPPTITKTPSLTRTFTPSLTPTITLTRTVTNTPRNFTPQATNTFTPTPSVTPTATSETQAPALLIW